MSDRNYFSDSRVRAARRWYESFDEKSMVATVTVYDGEADIEEELDIPVKFEVCPTCEGRGKHVNPSIDCDGLTAKDFREDPDLADGYFSGRCDVTCYGCGGNRVVPVPDESRCDTEDLAKLNAYLDEQVEFRRLQEAERRMGC
jgi:hypothetical protein